MNYTSKYVLNSVTSHPDRRVNPRYTVQIPIDLRQEDTATSLRLETTDLSRGGCYVHLIKTLVLGTYVQATLWVDNYPVCVRGRVVTRHPQFGNGIMFLDFEENGEQLLTNYLDAIAV
ncbi:MAG: PilZ domain-containing protein [Terriglobales bacterium]